MAEFGSGKSFLHVLQRRADKQLRSFVKRDSQEDRKRAWKRDLALRPNGTIDPWVSRNINVKKFMFSFLLVRLFLAQYVHRLCHQLYVSLEYVPRLLCHRISNAYYFIDLQENSTGFPFNVSPFCFYSFAGIISS